MVTDIASLFDLMMYTDKGHYIGKVYDVEIDASERRISTLVVDNYNKDIINEEVGFNVAETSKAKIPYRWVTAAADVVIIRHPLRKGGMPATSPEDNL
ncbi:MAG TPA: PRC-barrel domain-containing protein [Methanocella sp.]|nr:PRC-barrel domain-containing protein [Methanocella sp.]